jgi:hypothetical protein
MIENKRQMPSDAKSPHCLWQGELKRILKCEYLHVMYSINMHHLYLSATLKQCFTEFAAPGYVLHHVYMSVRGRIPMCNLIGRLFLGSGLQRMF